MQSQPTAHLTRSRIISEDCNHSHLQSTAQNRANFSFPEGSLEQSMSKYEREARERLEVSRVVQEISGTLHELIDSILHDKIYAQISRVVSEVLCIREEVSLFQEGTARQDQINEALKVEIRKLKRRVDELSSKSGSLNFQSFMGRQKEKVTNQRSSEGVQALVKEVYEFIHKNQATRLFRQCEAKLQKFQQQLQQSNVSMMEKIEQSNKKQKPINESLRKQLNDALSKEAISKQIKKSLKQNIRYLFDQLVRSRKDIDILREQMRQLCERQRELQFSQTMFEHKLA